jgi:hypothetical protein
MSDAEQHAPNEHDARPSDPKAALGYVKLHALWKADQDAYNAGRRISDAEYFMWVAPVRLHLTPEELAVFDESPKDKASRTFAPKRLLPWSRFSGIDTA